MRVERAVPEQWKNGDGWHAPGVTNLVAMPNHIAYTYLNPSTGGTGLRIYNDKGESVADIIGAAEVKSGTLGLVLDKIVTEWQNGKMYTVYMQRGGDGNGGAVVIFTVFDEDANQTFRKVLTTSNSKADLDSDSGVIKLSDWDKTGDKKVFNPATGELDAIAPYTPEKSWAGRVDGIDVYRVGTTLTSDKWTLPYSGFDVLGKYMSVERLDAKGNNTGQCDIIDPQTGKTVAGNDDACAPEHKTNVTDDLQSPLNGFILTKDRAKSGTRAKVLFVPGGKSFTVTTPDEFNAVSVDADGTFYAAGGSGSVLSLNPKTETAPKVEKGAQVVPELITPNGIAVFETAKSGHGGDFFFVLPKK